MYKNSRGNALKLVILYSKIMVLVKEKKILIDFVFNLLKFCSTLLVSLFDCRDKI